jgi:hypothetical protein
MHQPEIRKVIRAPMVLGHHMVHVDFLPIVKSLVAARTETVLPLGELPRATSRGLCSVPPLAPVVLEGRGIGGMRGGDQPMADDLGPGELPEGPLPLLILKHPAVLSTTDAAPILLGPPPAGFSRAVGFVANFAQEVVKGQSPLSVEGLRRPGSRTVRPQ